MNTHPPEDTDRDPVLDADIEAALSAAIEPEPLDAAMHERIKRKLLQRIAADNTERHVTHPSSPAGWQPFGDGIQIKVLHEEGGVMSYLLRLAAGASLPAHRHPVDEECVVLEGAVQIGALDVAAGGYHLGRRNIPHDSLCSRDGAVIFLRGAIPEAALAL